MTAAILPFSATLQLPPSVPPSVPGPRVFRKGDTANGLHIIDERDTPQGKEFLFAGWGVQSWIAESRLHGEV